MKQIVTRDHVWAAVRSLRKFTQKEVCFEVSKDRNVDVNKDTVKYLIKGLLNGGYIEIIGEKKTHASNRPENIYELKNDCGVHAPKITRAGKPLILGKSQENMWRSMRILQQFTSRELAVTSTTDDVKVSEPHARKYASDLHRAEYLRLLNTDGKNTGLSTYKLIRNTGPKSPSVQQDGTVVDRNLNCKTGAAK